ncbi:hypothetical protein O3M35_011782 [Rhynocoris fuscipes]|uniref:Cilia-and flagella-associated protein 96 n=1 Tax=Rhynocoris fuscipes TaxID=488301 RepID=A0AAW1D3N8_9HEMI
MGKKKVSEKNVLAENFGQHFGKPDLARWGDFAEMSYLHGAPYVFPSVSKQRGVGKQMLPGFPKMKTGLQDCYFDKEFKRIFIKEGYTSAYKIDAKTRMESAKHFITPQGFKYSNHTKWHSTPGDFYGTFGGIVEAFSPKQRPRKPREPEKRNALTSPGKKGSYGYADICINKYPEYISGDKYDVKAKPIFYSKTNPAFKGPSKPGYFDSNPYPEPCKDGAECAIKPFYKKYYDERWVKFGPFFPVGNGKPVSL